jgi:hypothetical protein
MVPLPVPMPDRFMRPFRILCCVGLALLLASCAGKPPKSAAVGAAGCVDERGRMLEASQDLAAESAADYWASLRKATPDALAAAHRITSDLGQLGASVDRLTIAYGLVKTCRLQRATKVQTDLGAGTIDGAEAVRRLAAERAQFQAELDAARLFAGRVTARQSVLQEAAERLIGEAPSISVKLARAVAAPPLPATPYRALDTTTIYAKPETSSARIAELRKGQRVQGPGGGPSAGWMTLYLNDGSLGYVQSASLKSVDANPVASPGAVARAPAGSGDAADPVVALALAARQTVPGKTQTFLSLLDASAETADLNFTPNAGAAPAATG